NGTASFTATNGAIALANAGNAFNGTVTLANTGTGNVSLTNNYALTLGNVTTGNGTLSVKASAGGISQATGSSITANGASSFNAANGVITLDSTGNAFTGAV